MGLLTPLALLIDSTSHSWFIGDRSTLFILVWGLTRRKGETYSQCWKNLTHGHSRLDKMVSCLLLLLQIGSYPMPIKYSPDMTQQSCSQCKYRKRKWCLLLCHPSMMVLCKECALITIENLPDLPLIQEVWCQSAARGKCKEGASRCTSKLVLSKLVLRGARSRAMAFVEELKH